VNLNIIKKEWVILSYWWSVVPLCKNQLKDVNPKDILENGLYRLCDTYKSGGGYDKLPQILEKRMGLKGYQTQFVVQLYGCVFSCPYCYVTADGVNGTPQLIKTEELIEAFKRSGASVFHLMGGAPAIYMYRWGELIDKLSEENPNAIFHSDLLLHESLYEYEELKEIAKPNTIYAVSIKGFDDYSYYKNTGEKLNSSLVVHNLRRLKKTTGLNYYITFTGLTAEEVKLAIEFFFIEEDQLKDSFTIDLINYEALKEGN
jgi:pyruvate-formate lyase-activating enzyme